MDWRIEIEKEPIPPEALKAALAYLVELGVVDNPSKGKPAKGMAWLARQLGVQANTVHAWLAGKNNLKGLSAKQVRAFFKELT